MNATQNHSFFSGFRQFAVSSSLALGALTLYLLFVQSSGDPKNAQRKWAEKDDNSAIFFTPFVPEALDFAGEKVPLTEDFEVQERLDNEMLINVHSHAATTMIFKRYNRWKDEMKKILDEEGVPEDFLYLMVAESSVRNATSYAGAQGYWQFMSAAAKENNLIINKYIDERNNPIKATRAACKLLKKAYNLFGSWTMAAASYNMGMNGLLTVSREQRENNYYNLDLNRETSRYLFRILSYKIIINNPAKFGYKFTDEDLYKPLKTRKVEVNKSILSLVQFAKDNGTNYKTLAYLNPWILEKTLPVNYGESYEILLPAKEE